MPDALKVLAIDDEEDILEALRMIYEYEGYEFIQASTGAQGLKFAEKYQPELILLDIKMPRIDGLEVLTRLKESGFSNPVVMISGHGTLSTAVEATKLGAFDFLEKPLDRDRLILITRNAIDQKRLADENRNLKTRLSEEYRIVGSSEAVAGVLEAVRKAAPTSATVMIHGESGTGKELVARQIYQLSKRSNKPFIQVNCAAIPEDLIESELFGHEKGSFTGATDRQAGKFVLADGCTLFLDEVGDMSFKTQAKVLRALQEGEVEPIGSQKTLKVDVRVIAATNKNLIDMIEKGTFREDLYFRLNVIPIQCPSLRERVEDIPELIEYFSEKFCRENNYKSKRFSTAAISRMCEYPWKGNVRELKNTVERILIMMSGDTVDVKDLPDTITSANQQILEHISKVSTLREFKEMSERAFLVEKLKENGWNISLTAQKIDTPRSNLYKKLEQYTISEAQDG
ncbi:sigma-54-dependent transcriptional regulator [Acidobacteriota bacterium]